MTTTNTMDTAATVKQSIALFDAGADLVRITAPGPKDAENLGVIKSELKKRDYDQPLVADIHFSPKAAMIALEHVEKVRINPGNFVDRKRFEVREYTDEQYQEELESLKESFLPLVRRAKALGRVLRIGSNHGSLSDRIMNRYGDTPLGMIESALEFIRFARQEDYHDILVSMKSSNPQVMVQAYRLLCAYFYEHGYDYPLHLGVTEAGGARDGRMKSALGIGSLLMDGIGDTIRVSLTEDPVQEIYAAKDILKSMEQGQSCQTQNKRVKEARYWEGGYAKEISFYEYKRLPSRGLSLGPISLGPKLGAKHLHRVFVNIDQAVQNLAPGPEIEKREKAQSSSKKEEKLSAFSQAEWQAELQKLQAKGCDALWSYGLPREAFIKAAESLHLPWVQDLGTLSITDLNTEKISIHKHAAGISLNLGLVQLQQEQSALKKLQSQCKTKGLALFLNCILTTQELPAGLELLAESKLLKPESEKEAKLILSLSIKNEAASGPGHRDISNLEMTFAYRLLCAYKEKLAAQAAFPPLLLRASYPSSHEALMRSSISLGALLLDGIGDALFLDIADLSLSAKLQFQLDLLQAARLRLSKTEYISCPSCGRTLFDLEETTARIRKRTGDLKGLKIAVMGCIVNGPGEMADADFGYVGAGPGKVHLYREKELVKANVPAEEADEELVRLIKESKAWPKDPE